MRQCFIDHATLGVKGIAWGSTALTLRHEQIERAFLTVPTSYRQICCRLLELDLN